MNNLADRVPFDRDMIDKLLMLATDSDPEPIEDESKKSAEALYYLGTKKWLEEMRADEEGLKELPQKSIVYNHVLHMLDVRRRKKEDNYHEDDNLVWRADLTWLYRYIDKQMSEREAKTEASAEAA